MLSILIPTYNYDVTNLVKTIVGQCDSLAIDFEILVSDDDSSDKSRTENNVQIDSWDHCKYLTLTKNIGRTANRKYLAEQASYDWLLFLDSDVLPESQEFISNYIEAIKDSGSQIVFGGIAYRDTRPDQNEMLRWQYGKKREAKTAIDRKKTPHFIISQNLLIKKKVFFLINTLTEKYYGLDNFFSNQLKNHNITVLHIDNPVIHLGLETNEIFLEKSLRSVKVTHQLEEQGLMDNDIRPLQQSYLRLKKLGLTKVFKSIIGPLKPMMLKNFKSRNPNLFWFDLYRLHYYIQLKEENV